MPGGGASWFYLMVGGLCKGAAHEDNKQGMVTLRKREIKLNKERE